MPSSHAIADPALDVIWPDVGDAAAAEASVEYHALPNAHNVRILIPCAPAVASDRLLWALRDASTVKARARTRVIAMSWRTPLGVGSRVLLSATGGVTTQLSDHFARADIVVAVHLGPARANRKPVLAVSSRDGELLGFAKLGINALTDRLVSGEAAGLTVLNDSLRSDGALRVPILLAKTSWQDHPMAIQSALVTTSPRTDPSSDKGQRLVALAQVALARSRGTHRDASSFLDGLRQRLTTLKAEAVASSDPLDRVQKLIEQVASRHDIGAIECGTWHGDWRQTNMAVSDHDVAVWDWERYAEGVPLGFDALHLELTTRAPYTSDGADLVPHLFAASSSVLAPFDVADERSTTVTALYLLELATRYLEDDQAKSGARLGDITQWMLPTLESRVGSPR